MASDGVSFGRRLTSLAVLQGDETALVYASDDGGSCEWSWRTLEERANQVARLFGERGVEPGDVVIVALHNSPEHVLATFGAWKLGAAVLPLRSDLPLWERTRLLGLAEEKLVVADWEAPGADVVSSAALEESNSMESSPPTDNQVPPYSRMIATSGSTGTPKIIATLSAGTYIEPEGSVDRDPLAALARGTDSFAPGRLVLVTSPLYHTNGFSYCYPALLAGASVLLMERFRAERAVDLIEQYRVAQTVMVPTMLQRVARLKGIRNRDLSSLEWVVYGGASLPEWAGRVWLDLIAPERFIFTYGGSEGLGLTACTGKEWLERPGTVGVAIGCDIAIRDLNDKDLPVGELGIVWMRRQKSGPSFRYLGVPTPDPVDGYRTFGDMGWVDEDGYLFIADRRQDMIVTGGVNVFPAEVEAALSEHPDIADVVVVGLPDPEWGHRVHAIVQPIDPTSPPDRDEMRAFCRSRISASKVPKSFECVDQIARTAAGKVNRSKLAEERANLAG